MSLFTSTLLLSFVVVGTPHILPCPAPRHQYTDSPSDDPSNPRPRRRRRRKSCTTAEGGEAISGLEKSEITFTERPERECPVPKPGGLVGRILGFREQGAADEVSMVQRPIVKVESVRRRRANEVHEVTAE